LPDIFEIFPCQFRNLQPSMILAHLILLDIVRERHFIGNGSLKNRGDTTPLHLIDVPVWWLAYLWRQVRGQVSSEILHWHKLIAIMWQVINWHEGVATQFIE